MLKVADVLRASKMAFDTNNAVNMLMTTPKDKDTAKPLMGPVPNWKRVKAVMSEVT